MRNARAAALLGGGGCLAPGCGSSAAGVLGGAGCGVLGVLLSAACCLSSGAYSIYCTTVYCTTSISISIRTTPAAGGGVRTVQ